MLQRLTAKSLRVRETLQSMALPPVKDDNDDRDSIIQLIKSYGKEKAIYKLRRICQDKPWITDDISIANTLIRSYAKCGSVKEAQEAFNQLEVRDVVSWSALIAGYVEQGFGEQALTYFKEMQSDGVIPNSVTYVCCLKACALVGALDTVNEIYSKVSEEGLLNEHSALGNALINAYAKCGALNEGQEVFNKLSERDVVSWNALIAGYAEWGYGNEALAWFMEMENDQVSPNSVTYVCSLKACAIMGDLEIVEGIHARIREQQLLNKDIVLGNSLINAYAKCGAVNESQEVFNQVSECDVVSWSALIAGYTEHGFVQESLACFRKMQNCGLSPTSVIYACSLTACASIGDIEIVKGIHAQINEQGLLNQHIALGTALLNAYAKCSAVDEAQEVFNQLSQKDVISWNALIAGYADQGLGEEALRRFRDMEDEGMIPDLVTYACSLKACAIVGSLEIVEEIHARLREQGLMNKDIDVGTTLVNAYAKCGALTKALDVFDQLAEKDVASCNALLAGYAQTGLINEMLQLFNRMILEGIFADSVTFLVLLNGCSHGALLEEGERLFCMIGTFGMSPRPEHYSCLVDSFGRAGQLDKAKCFVVDHTSTLFAFLGACQKWTNVHLGGWAFEKLLQLDPKCATAYVSLANIYAASPDEIYFFGV